VSRTAHRLSTAAFSVDAASTAPLHRQLYGSVRAAILDRRIRPGRRLPSSRALAEDLGVSRNTVLAAFDQLRAEGYLEGKSGSGTYVTRSLPDDSLRAEPPPSSKARAPRPPVPRSRHTREPPPGPSVARGAPRAFRPGPALELFPKTLWARIASRQWRRAGAELLAYEDPKGFRPLREAVATYLREARAVRCDADQVLIVNGAQQALFLAANVLADPGDAVWIEDPGYVGARGAFRAAGLRLIPVPLDAHGLDVRAGRGRGAPRLVYVSPSHQYPLGTTMSLTRRLELLRYASLCDAWVLEDDYDSEYRYSSRPLASLQGLDADGRVIYFGTFSKVLVPSIRLGYLVVPETLVDAFSAFRAIADRHSSSVEQAVVAEFIAEGHFERHIHRMRSVYAERQAALVDAARRHLAGLLDTQPRDAGLHLVGWLGSGIGDRRAARGAAAAGVEVAPVSSMAIEASLRPGLLLGYAGLAPEAIHAGARALARALSASRSPGRGPRARA
jgi:GntR family transcriptional regulator/MocR family aminotransferase